MGRFSTILRLALGALILSLGFSGPAAAQGRSNSPGVERAINAKNLYGDRLFDLAGVVGVGVGLDAAGSPAIIVLVTASEIRGLPLMLGGVNVELKVSGRFAALAKPNCEQNPGHPSCKGDPSPDPEPDPDASLTPTDFWPRPVPIGVSTGNALSCSAGTIGFRLKDTVGNLFALSNNHVYALSNGTGAPNGSIIIGSPIVQPGLFDTNCVVELAGGQIGTLDSSDSFVQIVFSTADDVTNEVDAAIAIVGTNCRNPEGETVDCVGNSTPPLVGYGTPKSATAVAWPDDAVMKFGRTTGLTRGTVTMINTTVNIGYSAGTARFVNQIIVESSRGAFIKAGDSGSGLVLDDRTPVGLLFAGNRSGKLAIANNIGPVLAAFGLSIDGE